MKKILFIAILVLAFGNAVDAYAPQYGISSGLVGYWTLDSRDTQKTSATAGTTFDISGNNNKGTLSNMWVGTSTVLGRIGQGIRFDGVNDYTTAGNASSLKPSLPITMTMWIKPSLNHAGGLVAFRDGEFHNGYWVTLLSLGGITLGYGSNTVCDAAGRRSGTTANSLVEPGKWTHIAAVIRGATDMTLSINGVAQSLAYTGTGGSIVYAAGSTLKIGVGQFGGGPGCLPSYYNGQIDDVRIYNRSLSENEIKALYRMGLTQNYR